MKKKNLKSLSFNRSIVSNLNGIKAGVDLKLDLAVSPPVTDGCSEQCNGLSLPTCHATLVHLTNCASMQNCYTFGFTCGC